MPSEVRRNYYFGEFRLDCKDKALYRNGRTIPLTRKSLETLIFLFRNRGRIVAKQEFFDHVWSESYVDETNLTQHIYRVRKLLSEGENGDLKIETVPKLGYRLHVNLSDDSPEEESNQLYSGKQSRSRELDPGTEAEVDEKSSKLGKLKSTLPIPVFVLAVGLALIATIAVSTFVGSGEADGESVRVAVLPFNQIGDSADEKLRVGIADTIISNLGNMQDVDFVPTSTILQFSDTENISDDSVFEIARRLRADVLLTGTIQRDQKTVRVNLQIYHPKKERQICTANFDREYRGVFDLQDTVSRETAKKLRSEFAKHEELGDPFN